MNKKLNPKNISLLNDELDLCLDTSTDFKFIVPVPEKKPVTVYIPTKKKNNVNKLF